MALQGKLSHPKRFITTTNDEGQAIIDRESVPADLPFYDVAQDDAAFATCYATDKFPVDIGDSSDINTYKLFLQKPPGLTVSTGTVLRYVDIPPGMTSAMHKTVSLDYGVVLEGHVELVLDSGDTQVMERGDICIQRATMHAWRNVSYTEWARMLYILQPAQSSTAGHDLREDYGGMKGVEASK